MALAAALMFVLSTNHVANAETWQSGFLIDSAPCYYERGGSELIGLLANQQVVIDVDSRHDGWVHVQPMLGDQYLTCWVDEYFVTVGMGQPEVPAQDPFPILGENTVNSDSVSCRLAPASSSPLSVVLYYGQIVQERADGVNDGWQMVTTSEGVTCYVSAEFLGIQHEDEELESDPAQDYIPAPVVVAEPTDDSAGGTGGEELTGVIQLPNTGTGFQLDSGPGVILVIVAAAILVVGYYFVLTLILGAISAGLSEHRAEVKRLIASTWRRTGTAVKQVWQAGKSGIISLGLQFLAIIIVLFGTTKPRRQRNTRM